MVESLERKFSGETLSVGGKIDSPPIGDGSFPLAQLHKLESIFEFRFAFNSYRCRYLTSQLPMIADEQAVSRFIV